MSPEFDFRLGRRLAIIAVAVLETIHFGQACVHTEMMNVEVLLASERIPWAALDFTRVVAVCAVLRPCLTAAQRLCSLLTAC
jgi:hypothetical protein